MKISQKLQILKKNVAEVETLSKIYSELIDSTVYSNSEAKTKQEEAKFVRDRMLKLTLSNKQLINSLEEKSNVK
ncbi:hypothetical protein HOK51_00890 [Candidatus Woesearchaeota archaeon]|jgi:hypothetical protein|nr:hypothetical protein [Candidatus Woesearchaeota archaeon]MBT6518371.1 hypothetical protein [Candidatus Woesearchaeota archaeon]MBT7368732.1 hypothetical protein [Candidatus Woesearchaeota archaeon]